jgi:hypothetical protein
MNMLDPILVVNSRLNTNDLLRVFDLVCRDYRYKSNGGVRERSDPDILVSERSRLV